MRIPISTTATMGLLSVAASGAISFTGAPLLEDFTGYDGSSGPTGWDASGFSDGAGFTENRGSSSGGVNTGGTYAFDVGGGDVALGVQPGGSDFTPGYYQLQVTNDSGAAVSAWSIAFESLSYNDQGRANSFNFSWSTDGSSFTAVASGAFTSVEAAAVLPAWSSDVSFSEVIGAPVASGGSLYLRWTGNDVSGGGNRDEFALDDVSIAAIPEPTGLAPIVGLGGLLLAFRRRR